MAADLSILTAALADRYRIERELGAGGMATVYLAEDLKHHRSVAIKVLRPDIAQMLGIERFLREIDIAAKLTHPHILPLLDSGSADGTMYYVTPYITGESLRQTLTRQGQLPIAEALRLATEVASALDYAHRQGVIHRDIKPENILIHEGHALVADFGIALSVAAAPAADRLTGTGLSLGTPQYMSPEQAVASRTIDAQTDIYGLGVVVYEMLVGDPPFPGSNVQAIVAKVLTERPHRPSEIRDTVPPAVDAAVLRALSKSPADRFASAAEFSRALAMPSRSDQAPRRRVARWTYAAGATAALLIGGVGARVLVHRSSTAGATRSAADSAAATRRSIAVLPFENLSADTSNAYFADGVQDEILTKLAGLGGLTVISRTSTAQYASAPPNLRKVARELGVATILEGSVQRSAGQVRVNVQLIDAATDNHIWAQTYDRELKNVFAVESDVATQIAEALKVTLAPAEAEFLAAAPTTDPVAYDLYLKAQRIGGTIVGAGGWAAIPATIAAYKQVIARDSTCAQAYAQLAFAEALLEWTGMDRSRAVMRSAEADVRKAMALRPDLPEAHLVLGYVYRWGYADYTKALSEYTLAAKGLPNSADVAAAIAYIDEGQGNPVAAVAGLRRAVRLDPRNAHAWCQLAIAYSTAGQYGPARQALMTALAVDPRTAEGYAIMSQVELMAAGDAARALSVLDGAPADLQSNALLIDARVEALLVRHDFAAASRYAIGLEPGDGLSALQALETKGGTLWLGGNRTEAAVFLSQAIDTLKEQLRTTTVPIQAYADLALAAARLGRLNDAQVYAKQVNAIAAAGPVPFDYGINPWLTLASAYSALGDGHDAVVALEKACPSACGFMLSGAMLRRDPTWDPIRADPGFQALLARYETGRG